LSKHSLTILLHYSISQKCIYPAEYEGHFDRLLIQKDEISLVVQKLAAQLCRDYQGTRPVLVCVLKGASPFFQHLCDALMTQKQGFDTEFIRVSSYEGTSSTGNVQVAGGLNMDHVRNRHVVLVEDIIDTGTTLSHLIPHLQKEASPKSIEVATLLSKRLPQPAKCDAKYVGFSIPNHFIIGYGLDYNELYRDTQDIFIISQEGIDFDATTLN
jgi:hypoxanthine phosphoribosyltransferase